jgi:hypothetical protein
MSDEEIHVDPPNPPALELADRLFAISMAGILGFIAVVFIFII